MYPINEKRGTISKINYDDYCTRSGVGGRIYVPVYAFYTGDTPITNITPQLTRPGVTRLAHTRFLFSTLGFKAPLDVAE